MFGSNKASSADNQQERLSIEQDYLAWYFVGFTEGEGSFNVSLKRIPYSSGWKLALSFNVSQKDVTVLKIFKEYFKCGTIRFRKDGVGYFEVRSISDLKSFVIPFFEKYQLKSSKYYDFLTFREILFIVLSGRHLEYDGFKAILNLREKMNSGGKRKFSNEFILANYIRQNPQRLYAEISNDTDMI